MLSLRERWGKSHTYTCKCIFFLFLLSLVLCAPLYTQGFFEGHDYWAHAMRITSTMDGLSDGQIPPQIGTQANAYGYSWNLFYGPLSNYLVVFFRILTIWIPGATMALAYKLFIFSTFFFSGFFLFRFVREVVKNENTALLAACLYLLAPYRIVDAFMRLAVGEMLVFVFLPLVFHGFYSLYYGDKTKSWYLAAGFAGVILSHMISTLFLLIAGVVVALANVRKTFQKQTLLHLAVNAGFAIGISAFFVFPLLEAKGAAEYFAFAGGMQKDVGGHAAYLFQLFFSKMEFDSLPVSHLRDTISNEMPQVAGLVFIACLLALPFVAGKLTQKTQRRQFFAFTAAGVICCVLSTSLIPWGWLQEKLPAVGNLQHPWRFLMLAVFFLSIVSAVVIQLLAGKLEFKHIFLVVLISLVYLSPLIASTDIQLNRMDIYDDTYFKDYMPQRAYEHMDYTENRSHDVEVLSGDAALAEQDIHGSKVTVHIDAASESVIELPFFYYPGHQVQTSGGTRLQTRESPNGFVCFTVPAGFQGTVSTAFRGTMVTKISFLVSVISVLGLAALVYWRSRRRHTRKSSAVPVE